MFDNRYLKIFIIILEGKMDLPEIKAIYSVSYDGFTNYIKSERGVRVFLCSVDESNAMYITVSDEHDGTTTHMGLSFRVITSLAWVSKLKRIGAGEIADGKIVRWNSLSFSIETPLELRPVIETALLGEKPPA